MEKKQKIGFIGLGLMGIPMSHRLIAAGYPLAVWNRNPAKTEALGAAGASVMPSISALVEASDIVMLCVSNTDAVEQIVFGPGGIAENAHKGHLIIDFSSIDPQATRRFSEKLSSETGAGWIDAPVSGGVAGAEAGTLVVMAGGDETTIEGLGPLLSHLSQKVTRMGPVGSGQATKICNQMLVSCNVMVMAEVLALAEKAGVDSRKIPEALKGGFADSIPLQLTGTRMANRDFDDIKWHVKTLLKDLTMASDLTEAMAGNTPMAQLAKNLMQQFSDDGYAEKDPCCLIEPYSNS